MLTVVKKVFHNSAGLKDSNEARRSSTRDCLIGPHLVGGCSYERWDVWLWLLLQQPLALRVRVRGFVHANTTNARTFSDCLGASIAHWLLPTSTNCFSL
jgi:hypothetical protein